MDTKLNLTKICPICGKEKSAGEFYLRANSKFVYGCKLCNIKNEREKRMKSYGITFEEYELRVEQQNGRCGICLRVNGKLRVDHCHSTKKFRGLLCHHCNSGLGLFGDSIESLQRAIDYLKRTKGD
jgi:Recombination endonuclease VII